MPIYSLTLFYEQIPSPLSCLGLIMTGGSCLKNLALRNGVKLAVKIDLSPFSLFFLFWCV